APVLVILLDGMSPAVARELLADLARLDWVTLAPEGRPMHPGLAAIPCVTEASRASLFCGRICTGTSDNEAAGFANHEGLRARCRRQVGSRRIANSGGKGAACGAAPIDSPVERADSLWG